MTITPELKQLARRSKITQIIQIFCLINKGLRIVQWQVQSKERLTTQWFLARILTKRLRFERAIWVSRRLGRINSSLRKREIAWDRSLPGTQTIGAPAFIMGLFGGRECKQTWRKAKWSVSAGFKQLKIVKQKVELKERKMKMWSWRKKMCLGRFYLENKTEECTVKQLQRWFLCRGAKTTGKKMQLDKTCLWYSKKCHPRGDSP